MTIETFPKRYRIWRDEQGIVHCTNPKGEELKPIPVHSPTGFEYGYGGSGPAELSLCILTDHLGREKADRCYQRFKWERIAREDGRLVREFFIETDDIDDWLEVLGAYA